MATGYKSLIFPFHNQMDMVVSVCRNPLQTMLKNGRNGWYKNEKKRGLLIPVARPAVKGSRIAQSVKNEQHRSPRYAYIYNIIQCALDRIKAHVCCHVYNIHMNIYCCFVSLTDVWTCEILNSQRTKRRVNALIKNVVSPSLASDLTYGLQTSLYQCIV